MAAVTVCSDFGAQENKMCHSCQFFPFYLPWSDGTRCHDLSFWMLVFKPLFHSPLSPSSRDSLVLLHFLPLEWYHLHIWGFPGSTSGKEPACQCRRSKRWSFNHRVMKMPWRRAWQPTSLFLPGEPHWQRSLVCYCSYDCSQTWLKWLSMEAHICISEVVDISPSNLDFSLRVIQPGI